MKEINKDSLRFTDLHAQEKEIISLIRDIGFGEICLTVKDGIPARVEEYKRSFKL